MLRRHTKSNNAGFTLMELSLVLGVLALMIAGVMTVVTQNTRRTAMAEVKRKMDVIEAALITFRRTNNRLPCPADSTMATTNQYFGMEGTATGTTATTCINGNTYANSSDTGGNPVAPDASFYDGNNTVGGDVPIQTLGLPVDYMFDPWGGRFFYAVDNRMTTTNSPFNNYSYTITNAGVNAGSISVNDGAGNLKLGVASGNACGSVCMASCTTANCTGANSCGASCTNASGAIAVLLSYGPDGHGAFQYGGVRKSTGNNNNYTKSNCNCDNNATATAWPNPPVFVQTPATSTSTTDPANFDDILRFYTRQSFLSSTDTSATR